jgi:hypothetical protein
MIKIIKEIFFLKEEGHKSSAKIELDLSGIKQSASDKFDLALKECIKKQIKSDIISELVKLCYTDDEISDTENAIKYLNGNSKIAYEKLADLKSKFPNAIYNYRPGITYVVLELSPSIDLLVLSLSNMVVDDL